ncbi:MAG: four helix bundle protein [Bacteroidetes bacterium]|nr:four helix bundle protein [Bacteroidota bacterium]MBL0071678.1 four helix bundle protein [Bacteroidota bacterium]
METKPNIILELTKQFALSTIEYTEELEKLKKYVISNQLLKSGTSIGANVWESQHAESKNDFIHKLKIAAKEASETAYWLDLCKTSNSYPNPDSLIESLAPIQKILTRIIYTTKNKTSKN